MEPPNIALYIHCLNIDEEGKMKHSLLSQHTDSIKKQICEQQQNKNKKL
jgi:hypothetical protein